MRYRNGILVDFGMKILKFNVLKERSLRSRRYSKKNEELTFYIRNLLVHVFSRGNLVLITNLITVFTVKFDNV